MTRLRLLSQTRTLAGRSVSSLGLGCWAIGGVLHDGATALGWGVVDDERSVEAIQSALGRGINLFDTADVYGAGHSERVLGSALRDVRSDVFIATKFGMTFDEKTRTLTGSNTSRDYVRRACEASLMRLQSDWIDLYQLHIGDLDDDAADAVADTLEALCSEGLVRAYGWSTDDPSRAARWVGRPYFAAVQHICNVLVDAPEMLDLCRTSRLASINRSPLAMGLLAGKMSDRTRFSDLDARASGVSWLPYFADRQPRKEWLERVAAVREILTSGGRSPAQGAIAWLWERSPQTLPIPGFRTAAQVQENVAALDFPPLTKAEMAEISRLSERAASDSAGETKGAGK